MTLEIVDAEVGHLLAIQAIYAHWVIHGLASFEESPPDVAEIDRRRQEVQERGLPYLAARDGALIQGFAYAGPYRARSAYRFTIEDSVYVAPEARGRGVGRALLGEVIRRCELRSLRQMLAVIGDSANHASVGLHEALGFRHAGHLRSVGFKHGHWVDSVLMQRALGQGDASLPHPPPKHDRS
jgi:L-amino acid N-acyltransferase YncA